MDWFAITSSGVYPAPASTSTQRAAYAVSWGLLGLMAAATIVENTARGLYSFGMNFSFK